MHRLTSANEERGAVAGGCDVETGNDDVDDEIHVSDE
jgi:hypothetical protein